MSKTTLHALFTDPNYYFAGIDWHQQKLRFLGVNPRTYEDSPFLDARLVGATGEQFELSLKSVLAHAPQLRKPSQAIHFLFHSAFCGSTLLARGLNAPGASFALREPLALLDLASFKRSALYAGCAPENWRLFLHMTLGLLKKTYRPGETVLIKPTNVANNLIDDLLATEPDAKAILLYSDLDSFLLSCLKKEQSGREGAYAFARNFALDSDYMTYFPDLDLERLDYLQVATLAWHMQFYGYSGLLARHDARRLRTLTQGELMANPSAVLQRAYAHYGIPLPGPAIDAIAQGPVFRTHAKDKHKPFDEDERRAANERVREQHKARLEQNRRWADRFFERLPVNDALGQGLMSPD